MYTLSLKFVPAQVRGKNCWSTSQVRLKILNYRTLLHESRFRHVSGFLTDFFSHLVDQSKRIDYFCIENSKQNKRITFSRLSSDFSRCNLP